MESPSSHAGATGPAPVELIVQNGRLRGESRPLHQPLTLVGRAAGCDVRLNAAGVHPLHCAVVHGPSGVLLRELQASNATRVNGKASGTCTLADGDLVTIGPFTFQVRINQLPTAGRDEADIAAEKEALRIQAAAVVAQQAALTEEEAKLQQRGTALEQQEGQLAKHLEEKRQKLIELRDQARAAHGQLRQERKLREAQLADGKGELLALRREVEHGRSQLRLDRHRLLKFRRRLKQRWHRHWAAERAAMQQQQQRVANRLAELNAEAERLRQEREAQRQARLSFNAEVEIGRRQLHAAWDKLRLARREEDERQAQAQADLFERLTVLERRERALVEAERALTDEAQQWQEMRQELEKEHEGLENRIRNYRHKIFDREAEVERLDVLLAGLRLDAAKNAGAEGPKTEPEGSAGTSAAPVHLPVVASLAKRLSAAPPPGLPAPRPTLELTPDVAAGMAILEKLAGELADQRMHLMEQCQRLVEAQRRWHQYREAAASELEVLGRQLHDRDRALQAREETQEAAEVRVRQQQREAANLQRYLEGWQTRMAARESTWEADRERLLADLQGREKLAEQRLRAIDQLHQKWVKRRGREVDWLRGERAACEKLRRECVAVREGWLKRRAALEQEQRTVAEKTLALEQFQQEQVGQAGNAAAAGRRLEKLRRRWAALSAPAEKALAEQWEQLKAEAQRLEAMQARVNKQTARLTAQENDLGTRLSEWEQNKVVAADEANRRVQELASAQSLRDRYEKQVYELRDEVERLARLFLDEAEPLRLHKAA